MDKIIMICTEGESSNYVYNKVIQEHEVSQVLIVQKESINVFIKRRIKKLGFLKVIGQIFFVIYSKLVLNKKSKKRINEIRSEYNLINKAIPKYKKVYIESVNSNEMRNKLNELNPNLVIINGTPIIKKYILEKISAHFINIHVGITPKYRGVHGGYWSLYNNDEELFGVTTHLVDEGIDSGGILEQNIVEVSNNDTFLTYPHLQLGSALLNYNTIIKSLLNNDFSLQKPMTSKSKIWYHPTITQYIYGKIFKKVK